jgi:hypothetical protein
MLSQAPGPFLLGIGIMRTQCQKTQNFLVRPKMAIILIIDYKGRETL